MKILSTVLLVSVLLFSFATNTFSQVEVKPSDNIIIDAPMQINLVMIGDTWSMEDQKNILDRLVKSYRPNIAYENRTAGVNYTYRYVFTNMTSEKSNELFAYMNTVAVENTMPEFIAEWIRVSHPELVRPDRQTYKMVSAFAIESWLSKLEREQGYTIYFLKPSTDQVGYFHTYRTAMKDPDTGREFVQEGMMGFGGKYRFYFIDLTAGPWFYPYVPTSDGKFIGQFHKNINDIRTEDEYYAFIAGYVNDAIMLLFTPSYLYSPVYKLNHKIDIFLIDMTAGRVFHDVSGKFINKSTIETAFAKLIPYAKWSSDIQGHSFDSLPRELQRAVLRSLTFKSVVGGGDIILVRSADLIAELNKWVTSNLSSEQLAAAEKSALQTVFVPVVLFVFDKEAYVDKEAVLGTAVPDPSDKTIPCCAVVAVDKHVLFDIGTGLSIVTIHEMGHVLGLRHPHDGYGPNGEFSNWFFDWSYTPLTYSSPSGLGCGLGHACGLIVTEFGQFNYDALDRGMVLYLMNQAQKNIRDVLLKIEHKGFLNDIPSAISSRLSIIEQDMQKAKDYFVSMTYFNHNSYKGTSSIMDPMDDAFDYALRAVITSEELFDALEALKKEITGIDTLTVGQPTLVDASGNMLTNVEVGKSVGIRAQIFNNANEVVTVTYIVQLKDSNGVTVFITWLDGISVSGLIESSIFWTPDIEGEYKAEIFVWKNLSDPVPFAPITVMNIAVNAL
ncbi:MAG: hypothetical protein QXU32_03635 [Nitrososphaerales archaeon]